jgi:hypothetical protein
MNDQLYIITIVLLAVLELLIFEIIIYLLANRLKMLKDQKQSANSGLNLTRFPLILAIFMSLNFLLIFHLILHIRMDYLGELNSSDIVPYSNSILIMIMVLFLFLIGLGGLIAFILWKFIKVTNTQIRFCYRMLFGGIISIEIGSFLVILNSIFIIPYVSPILIEIIYFGGVLLFGIGLIWIPSLNEGIACLAIDAFYLTHADGTMIAAIPFTITPLNDTHLPSSQLDNEFLASSIVGIEGILQEISSQQGMLKTLVYQNKTLLVERTSHYLGVYVAEIELQSLRISLSELMANITVLNLDNDSKTEINKLKELTTSWFKINRLRIGSFIPKLFGS